jgi:hypothetical protein
MLHQLLRMTLLLAAIAFLVAGALFVLVELFDAPVGFEDAKGFHAVEDGHESDLHEANPFVSGHPAA